jgi:hypothetical protein
MLEERPGAPSAIETDIISRTRIFLLKLGRTCLVGGWLVMRVERRGWNEKYVGNSNMKLQLKM